MMRGQFRAQTHSRSSDSSDQRLLRAQGLSGMPAAAAAAAARQHPRMVRAQAADAEPSITLKFMTPEAPNDPVVVECPSGEQLRAAMLENKVDLYTTWGKIWSCGGAGQCGTCIVQVLDDAADLLSERTATEDKKLNKKPGNWRLACQTIVGDGENSGTVVIQTKPQGK